MSGKRGRLWRATILAKLAAWAGIVLAFVAVGHVAWWAVAAVSAVFVVPIGVAWRRYARGIWRCPACDAPLAARGAGFPWRTAVCPKCGLALR
jgi:hypothetical protein